MMRALIVCHGQLGQALVAALSGIFGPLEGVEALSNEGLSAEALTSAVEKSVTAMGGKGVIFTDYFGGSCATACLAQLAARPGLHLVSGVNLPSLIYYLTHRDELAAEALLRGIVHRGQNAVRELGPPGL
jgi:fructoselysine/glucoselysine PTS system EIIA component